MRGRKISGAAARKAKRLFLESLASTGVVREAAAEAKISRDLAYRWRSTDKKFSTLWDRAIEDAADRLEREALRRAVEGVERPVFQGGVEVGKSRTYSDPLLMFLLRGMRPEKFRDRSDVTSQGAPIAPPKILVIPDEPAETTKPAATPRVIAPPDPEESDG